MISRQFCFPFKGGRDYVHGTDIFDRLAHFFVLDVETPFCISFHRVSRSPSLRLIASPVKSDLDQGARGEAVVHGHFDKGRERTYVMLSENESDDCSVETRPYHEQAIVDRSSVEEKRIVIAGLGEATFIENVVAMNKHLLQSLYPVAEGKWLFTRIELEKVPVGDEQIEMELLHNLNFKLTKTSINVSGRFVGNVYFTMAGK